MGFPENLAALRRQRGLTQAALAESLDVLANQISLYESGKSEPSLGVLHDWPRRCRRPVMSWFLGRADLMMNRVWNWPSKPRSHLLNPEEQATVRALLDAFLHRPPPTHGARRDDRAKKRPSR